MPSIAPRTYPSTKGFGKAAGLLTTATLLTLLAAGCVQAPPSAEPGPTRSDSAATSETETAALPPASVTPESPPPVTIDMLMGADEAKLHRLLGLPQFRRNDPPARLLRYRAAGCLLDLFLYPPKDSANDGGKGGTVDGKGIHRVTHIQARGGDGMDRPAPPCLDAIVEARQKAKTG